MARTLKLFPRIRGAADQAPDPGGSDCEPELEVVSFPSFTEVIFIFLSLYLI